MAQTGAQRQAAYAARQAKKEPWTPTKEPRSRQRLLDRGVRDLRTIRDTYREWLRHNDSPETEAGGAQLEAVEEYLNVLDAVLELLRDTPMPRIRVD